MGAWKFRPANAAMPLAITAYTTITGNEQMNDEDRAAFLERFEGAKSTKALKALAKEAADFESVVVEPTDPFAAPESTESEVEEA
jgi:hypothetical protein